MGLYLQITKSLFYFPVAVLKHCTRLLNYFTKYFFVDLCLEVEGGLVVGAKLLVNENALTAEEEDTNAGTDMMQSGDQGKTEQDNKDLMQSCGKLLV